MAGLIQAVDSPAEISDAAADLRQVTSGEQISPNEVMTVFDSWAKCLDARELDRFPSDVAKTGDIGTNYHPRTRVQ